MGCSNAKVLGMSYFLSKCNINLKEINICQLYRPCLKLIDTALGFPAS